jgi:hypothetical protein
MICIISIVWVTLYKANYCQSNYLSYEINVMSLLCHAINLVFIVFSYKALQNRDYVDQVIFVMLILKFHGRTWTFWYARRITHISLLFVCSPACIYLKLIIRYCGITFCLTICDSFSFTCSTYHVFRLPFSGIQLGYTVIFGWYAAFLFIRTGPANSLFVTENKKFGYLFMLAIIVDLWHFLCLNSAPFSI